MIVFIVASKAKIVLRYMGIGLRFGDGLETFSFVKNRAPVWQNRATISGTLHLGCNLMRKSYSDFHHRSTILAFLSFLLKAKLFYELRVEISERRISIFWSCTSETKVGDHQELITGHPIHVMNPSCTLVIYALAMSS